MIWGRQQWSIKDKQQSSKLEKEYRIDIPKTGKMHHAEYISQQKIIRSRNTKMIDQENQQQQKISDPKTHSR